MSQNVKNIAVVSLSTVGSRLLGLVRDALIFAALGASVWSSAFILAFTLPNLFRRLFGEGALSSALVPVFS
ncbi:MAG: lipid II flippase MurJ, partial [Opitutales bacterium]